LKHGKNPTAKQKAVMTKARLNPSNWLVVKSLHTELHIVNRETGRPRVLKVAQAK